MIWFSRSELDGMKQAAYNIADNQTGRTSFFNDLRLAEILKDIRSDGSVPMESTGFSQLQIDALLEKLKPASELEPVVQPTVERWELRVECPSEAALRELQERLTREGFSCMPL